MDDVQDLFNHVPPDQELKTELSLTSNASVSPEHCWSPVSHYFMWNSGDIPPNGKPGEKRKRVLVTMEEKLRAIQRLDAGEPIARLAKELGVGKSTVSDWKKHRIEIESWYANQAGASCIKARKTMRKGKHAKVEKALYHWFEYVRSRGYQISGPLLQQKALQFKDKIEGKEGEEFTAGEGWLDRWKKRFGIGSLVGTNILKNKDDSLIEELKKDLFGLGDIKEEQLYCCGRTFFNFRIPPKNIFRFEGPDVVKNEMNEESVLILACSNATGNHKLRLSFIGKSEKFQAFDTIKDNEFLPFWYSQQKEVWLDGNVFKSWFEGEFVPAVEKNLSSNQLPRKAVLLVTNYPSFGDLTELRNGDIRVMFIPLLASSLCQPMDQGILESLKKKYWCRLLSSVISTSTNRENCFKTVRKVDLIEAIQFTSEVWEEIPLLTFTQSWKHIINQIEDSDWAEFEDHEISKANDDKELVTLIKNLSGSDDVGLQDLNEWLANGEDEEIICEDIVAMILKDLQTDLDPNDDIPINEEVPMPENIEIKAELPVLDSESSVETISPQIQRIRHSEGFKAISKSLEYISQQEEAIPEDIIWLIKWRDIASKKNVQEEKKAKKVKRPKLAT